MKIYTKTGDAGTTGLYGGGRVSKDDGRICAYGSVDELNAFLGILRSSNTDDEIMQELLQIQHELFCAGAELATPSPEQHQVSWDASGPIERLESKIDHWQEGLPTLRNFILPGGTVASAHCHAARTICRRCEREVVHFGRLAPEVNVAHIIIYLNRLSDLLFVLARRLNHVSGIPDVCWTGSGK